MHPQRKKRLLLILFLVAGVGTAVGLMTYSLSQNINLFMTPRNLPTAKCRWVKPCAPAAWWWLAVWCAPIRAWALPSK